MTIGPLERSEESERGFAAYVVDIVGQRLIHIPACERARANRLWHHRRLGLETRPSRTWRRNFLK
jgi:hypothetical protein